MEQLSGRNGLRRSVGLPLLAVLGAMALPGIAQAADGTSAPPAGGRLYIRVPEVIRYSARRLLALRGRRWMVRGTVTRYVPYQHVVVRFLRDGRTVLSVRTTIRRASHGRGSFVVRFRGIRLGPVVIRAVHAGTKRQHRMAAVPRRVLIVSPDLGYGARAPLVRVIQRRLASLHYAVSHSDVYDAPTERAVLAYRKVNRMPRTTRTNHRIVLRLVRRVGAFHARFPGEGRHVEGDLSRQVLALVDHGRVYRVFTMSSGKPSTPTVRGYFHVYRKTPGTNDHGMVYPSYFFRGYAVHGYHSVPVYAASHGCLRVPIPDARFIYNWIHYGDGVHVYP